MPSAGAAPASLIALGHEAIEAVAATDDIESFGGVALRNEARDAIFKPLPSSRRRRTRSVRCRWSPSGTAHRTWPVTG
jgi:hypothetical protein